MMKQLTDYQNKLTIIFLLINQSINQLLISALTNAEFNVKDFNQFYLTTLLHVDLYIFVHTLLGLHINISINLFATISNKLHNI